jgi:hypothetical protein
MRLRLETTRDQRSGTCLCAMPTGRAGMDKSEKLTPGAQMFWNTALEMSRQFGHSGAALQHFLLVLLDRYGPMAESLASGLRAREYHRQVQQSLQQGEVD